MSAFIAIIAVVAMHVILLPVTGQELTGTEIKRILIQQSIRTYSGACPYPYNVMRNGRKCGGNSAYSKPGGAEPLCYDTDVTDEMVEKYRKRH